MSRRILLLSFVILFVLAIAFSFQGQAEHAQAEMSITPTFIARAWNYLPAIYGLKEEPTATATNTPTNTPKPPPAMPTDTPQPSNTGDVRITKIFFDGQVYQVESDEYVEIKNFDNKVIRLGGWKLYDEGVKHTHTFPTYNMQPGETCRVYTNENHPEWCGFNWRNGNAIWNNDGDVATLKDASGTVIDTCSYTGSGTTKYC